MIFMEVCCALNIKYDRFCVLFLFNFLFRVPFICSLCLCEWSLLFSTTQQKPRQHSPNSDTLDSSRYACGSWREDKSSVVAGLGAASGVAACVLSSSGRDGGSPAGSAGTEPSLAANTSVTSCSANFCALWRNVWVTSSNWWLTTSGKWKWKPC